MKVGSSSEAESWEVYRLYLKPHSRPWWFVLSKCINWNTNKVGWRGNRQSLPA